MAGRGIKAVAGPLFFAVFACLFLGGSFAMWPPDLFGTPFAEMPLSMLLRAVASPALAIVGVEFLCGVAIALLVDS